MRATLQGNRRDLLRIAAAGATMPLMVPTLAATAAQSTPEAPGSLGRVEAPAWAFTVHEARDPYDGQMQAPQSSPPGTRYAALDVEVENGSEQSLNFTPVDIRLRDGAGVEYRGGSAIGTEPMINPRNLNPGELSRGWVWFILPEEVEIVEVAYVAPGPQFRLAFER
jgi:hypothetical protein